MSEHINRRQFLGRSASTALALGLGGAGAAGSLETAVVDAAPRRQEQANRPKKSVMFSMLPGNLSLEARFQLAKEVGFEGVEAGPVGEEKEALAMRAAAEKAGIPIHSVIYGGWENPLSSADPAVVERGLESTRAALQSAKWMGADDILLVPGVVTAQTRYKDAYARSQKNIRTLIPTAEKLGVMILI